MGKCQKSVQIRTRLIKQVIDLGELTQPIGVNGERNHCYVFSCCPYWHIRPAMNRLDKLSFHTACQFHEGCMTVMCHYDLLSLGKLGKTDI